ncbi:MAG: M3 family oligoendopeptidase [Bacilli bacterium]|jgi:pepF/M3 family oligoendopeptidase|nr:M3 family oligoendopeptidase [Bacilli bacterium]MDY0063571.1 M3 family oligoendopeptidase [Bacilli bacterium]
MYTWNLDKFYKGLDDPQFHQDQLRLEEKMEELSQFSLTLGQNNPRETLKKSILLGEEIHVIAAKLFGYISLQLATDSTNADFSNAMVVLRQKMLKTTLPETKIDRYVALLPNLEEVIASDPLLEEVRFILLETKANHLHLLSDEEEVLAAELNQSGGSLFSKMQTVLTSTLEVDYEGTTIPLSKVRNLAYDADPLIRKSAYFAEKLAYKKIERSSAFALNGIKKEVITMARKRKYDSPLARTVSDSRINNETLDALLTAMKEYLPVFRQYLKAKAALLGHPNGLPFYDLFAPMGSCTTVYTIEEAQAFILKNFAGFSADLHDLAKRAFDEDWIDYLPKAGKSGGAFCASNYALKESRILTNFNGSIGDISTIAHELGHAYHNFNIFEERVTNTNYPMPIAETASILCETIVKRAAFAEATSKEEKLGLIEQELQDATQVIVDILSRYLFETEVFKRCEQEFLNEKALNQIMLQAQKEAYGDGLDPDFLNEGMWINKSHYYSTGRSFYNFPYAFGLLFAKGIYAQYQTKGSAFVDDLKKLLRNTGKSNLMDVAGLIGIDITKVDFWRSSLEVIKEDVNLFIELTK